MEKNLKKLQATVRGGGKLVTHRALFSEDARFVVCALHIIMKIKKADFFVLEKLFKSLLPFAERKT